MAIQNVVAKGGDGGDAEDRRGGSGGGLGAGAAIYAGNGASPIISNVTCTNCSAQGGNAPTPAGGNASAGGGGYLSGNDGGNGAATGVAADAGNYGGGGGGACSVNNAAGVSGAGGGGGSQRPVTNDGALGGFGGGGGGGGRNGTGGGFTFGGGAGGNGGGTLGAPGGGGAALGGAIFTDSTSTVTIATSVNPFSGSFLTAGTGANSGATLGTDLFLASGGNLRFDIPAGTVSLSNPIEADTINTTGGVEKIGGGILNFSSLTNTYQGSTTITAGTLRFDADTNLGVAGSNVVLNGGTWEPAVTPLTSNKAVSTTASSFINVPAGFTFTSSGLMTGASGYTKTGTGIFVPTNANVGYSGTTTLNAGTIQVSADNPLGTGLLALNGGVFEANGSFSSSRLVSVGGAATIQTTGAGTTLSLNGAISGGAVSLNKIGTGTLELGGANTFTVPTTVTAGTLSVGADNHFGTGSLTLNGGVFEATSSLSSSKLVSIGGPTTIQTTGGGTTLQLNGAMNGAVGSLDKTGAGILELGGANTFTVPTTVTAGLLRLIGSGTLGNSANLNLVGGGFEIAAGAGTKTIGILSGAGTGVNLNNNTLEIASGTYSGVISGTGGITKYSGGTLELSGGSTYTGQSTINDGTLSLSGGGTLGSNSPLNIAGAGTFEIAAGAGSKTIGTLTGSGGIDLNDNDLSIPDGNFSGDIIGTGSLEKITPGTLTLSGTNTYSGGTTITDGILIVNADNNFGTGDVTMQGGEFQPIVSFLTSKNFAITGPNPAIINTPVGVTFTLAGTLSGAFPLTKTGAGTFIPTSANVGYSGTTSLNAGTLQVSADDNLGTGPLVLNGGIFEIVSSFISSRLVSITGLATIHTPAVGTTLTLNGVVSGGAVSLDKTGSGTLELGGANTFTVPTTVSSGLLRLTGLGTLGNAADLNLTGGGFEIALGAGTKTIGSLSGSGTGVNLNNNTLEIASGSYSGVISGAGGVTKYGIGTLDVFGVNTYTGQSTITGGVLRLSAAGTLGANSPLNIGAAGGFEIATGAGPKVIGTLTGSGGIDLNNNNLAVPDGNFSGDIIGTGSLQKITPGTLTLSGTSTYSGGTIITDGTLVVSADNNLGTGDVSIKGGEIQSILSFSTSKNIVINGPNPATINTPPGVNLTLTGTLSGAFPVVHTGGGTLTLTGANTLTGLTSLTAGTIRLNSAAMGPLTMSAGTFLEGVGTINGDLFNDGTISPGFSIGTKTVTGNYTQTAGGTYIAEIDPGGGSDLLNIGGTATLNGTVDLQPLPGVYLEGSTYIILQAAGGLGGTQFSNLIESHPLTFGINYTPTQAIVYILSSQTIVPESPVVKVSGNAQAFLDYLFCSDGSYTPVEPDIVYVLENLTSLSPEAFVQEIELLTPQQFRGLPLTGLQNTMKVGQIMLSRLNSHDFRFQKRCHDQELQEDLIHDVWVQPVGYYYQQDRRANGVGFDVRTYGFSGGTTLTFGDHLTLGIGTSYLYSNLHWKENAGMAKMHTFSLGPAVGWIEKNWFANFLLLGGRTFYDVDRTIRFAKIQRIAHNDHKSWDLQGTLSGGYRYQVPSVFMHHFYLQPEVNLSVVSIIESGYQERGSQSLDLDVKSKHSSFFRSQINLRMIKDFHINDTCVSPSIRVGWLKDVSLQNGKYQSSLYGIDSCKSYFVTRTTSKATDQLVLGAETLISPHERFSFELKYEANIGSRSAIQEGTARLQWEF